MEIIECCVNIDLIATDPFVTWDGLQELMVDVMKGNFVDENHASLRHNNLPRVMNWQGTLPLRKYKPKK